MSNELTGLTRHKIISELTKSPHGKLAEYLPVGVAAALTEPEFFAHMIAWNRLKGQIRDSQVALPVIALAPAVHPHFEIVPEFEDNAFAHLAMLDPRMLLRAVLFSKEVKAKTQKMRRLVITYLRAKEANWSKFERMALQHRNTLLSLYSMLHIKPGAMADAVLYKREFPRGSLFESVKLLKDMTPAEAAGTIMNRRIPFLIAQGALGEKAKDPTLVLALIERMSPAELVTNSKMLERLGVKTVPALRAAYDQALARAGGSKKGTFKATAAADAVEEVDEGLATKLRDLQERQITALGGIDGDWAVLADKSQSMMAAIDAGRHLAATLAKMVTGKVYLVFFDTAPQFIDVTGLPYDEILKKTKNVTAGGGTSIGCALDRLLAEKHNIDGIAVVSDAQENNPPMFATVYQRYCREFTKNPPVYLYRFEPGSRGADVDLAHSLKAADVPLDEFDMRGGFDYYSLPNIAKTMRTNRYSLVDEIMATPLLKLEDVLGTKEKEAVSV